MAFVTIARWLLHRLIVRPLVFGLFGIAVTHRERLPREGPAIVVANHNSHIDSLVLLALFPIGLLRLLRPVAASDYFMRNRALAWVAINLFGIIPVRRTGCRRRDGDPIGDCSNALQRGEILILYPEGTRGEPDRLSRFKSGIVHLAKRHPDVPIIPVFLHGSGRALPKGATVPLPVRIDVAVGHTRCWNGDRRAFLDRLHRDLFALRHAGDLPNWRRLRHPTAPASGTGPAAA